MLIVDFTAETFVIDDDGRATVCLQTNTGIAVDLNISVILLKQMANASICGNENETCIIPDNGQKNVE